jgi:hypothetical protein
MRSKRGIGVSFLLVVTLLWASTMLAAGRSTVRVALTAGNDLSFPSLQDSPDAVEVPAAEATAEAGPDGIVVSAEPEPAAPPEDEFAEGAVAPAAAMGPAAYDVVDWRVENRIGIGTDTPQAKLDIVTAGPNGGQLLSNGNVVSLRGLNDQVAVPRLPYIEWRQPSGTRAMYLGWGNTGGTSKWVDMRLENSYNLALGGGRVGIGTTAPGHLLSVVGGPTWTSNGWGGSMELANATAIGWRTNNANQRFGMGHTNGGFYIFRTASDPGTAGSPAVYDFTIRDSGLVGIGAMNPGHRLSIADGPFWTSNLWRGSVELTNASAIGWQTNTGGQRFGMGHTNGGFYIFRTASNPGTTGAAAVYDLSIKDNGFVGIGTTSPATKLHVNGTTRTNTLQITGGGDLAEPFTVAGTDAVEPGMVVAIDRDNPGQLRIADHAYDRTVAGVVSGAGGINPGLILQQEGSIVAGEHPVALTGRVYVWADATTGAIEPGDLLTTSDTPGHAMKVSDYALAQGAILGKAMTSLEEGTGLVLVLVSLQ